MESAVKLFDRKNYPERDINLYEIVAYYFVNYYYNYLYKIAKQKKSQNGNSITDEYKNLISYYIKAFQYYGEHYTRILSGMNATYQQYTRHETFTVADFTDRFLQAFIPSEFYEALATREKDQFMITILTSIVTEFSRKVIEHDMLTKIIDDRRDVEHFRFLKSYLVDLQIMEREKMTNTLISKIKSDNDHIPRHVAIKMQQTIQSLAREKVRIAADLKKQKMINMKLINYIKEIQKIAATKNNVAEQIKTNIPVVVPPPPVYHPPPPPPKREPEIDIGSIFTAEEPSNNTQNRVFDAQHDKNGQDQDDQNDQNDQDDQDDQDDQSEEYESPRAAIKARHAQMKAKTVSFDDKPQIKTYQPIVVDDPIDELSSNEEAKKQLDEIPTMAPNMQSILAALDGGDDDFE